MGLCVCAFVHLWGVDVWGHDVEVGAGRGSGGGGGGGGKVKVKRKGKKAYR